MMNKSLEEFLRYVKDRAYNLEVRSAKPVLVSIYFISRNHKVLIVSEQKRKVLFQLMDSILDKNPDELIVEIKVNGKLEKYNYQLNFFNEMTVDLEHRNNGEQNRQYENHNSSGLNGLSQVNIESIVNKRLEEERKERELLDLKTNLTISNEQLTKNKTEIESLKFNIEEKESEIVELENIIEKKKSIKYYAGLTGDILQSFGIKKEAIASPLAGLLGASTDGESKAIEQQISNDDSGIVEDASGQTERLSQREEMIMLISEFLKQVNDNTLNNVFSIFSEIESNPQISGQLIEYLKNIKQK